MNDYISDIEKRSHILTLELPKLSQSVFELNELDKRILRYLALKGPMNLSELAEYTIKFVDKMERWALKKHFYGSPKFLGLIPHEYVSVTHHNKKENKYRLTTKGVLASLAIVPLESNISFQNYVKYVANYLPSKGSQIFIKKYITEFIKLLLSWHYLNGIVLKKQKSSTFYYMEFFETMRRIGSIDITISEQKEHQEFLRVVKNCIGYASVIDLITSGEMFLSNSTFSMVSWENTTPFKDERGEAGNEYWFGENLWTWPLHIGHIETVEKNERKEVTFDEYYTKNIVNEVNYNLKQIGINLEWKSKLD